MQAQRLGGSLQILGLDISAWTARIEESGDYSSLWQQVTQQTKLFGTQFSEKEMHAGDIAARPAQACDQSDIYRIIAAGEDDGDRRCRRLCGASGNPTIGYVPQVRTLLPDLRVRGLDFIASSLRGERWGVSSLRRADHVKINKALAAVGARELAERPLSAMSGGERQRLMLAQALLGGPRLLLLDEPLISLDYRYQEAVIDLVRRFARDHNITVLFSAHELNQLIGALDRVLYLGNGRAALGTVAEVVTAPVLSRLYGADLDVVRADGHIFVLSRGRDVERADHLHDDGHHHDHDHRHHA